MISPTNDEGNRPLWQAAFAAAHEARAEPAEKGRARESPALLHVTGNSESSLAIRTKTPPQSPVLIDCANSPADCAAPFSNSPHNCAHP